MPAKETNIDKPAKTKKMWFVLHLGFFAGFIWGALKLIEFGLKFTEVSPGFLIEPFFKHSFLISWRGMAVGWGSFILFSMFASCLYGLCMRRVKGPLLGFAYGLAWWALIYLVIGPWSGMVSYMWMRDWNSFFTDLCLFILWGLFIGYSIAMEFTNEEGREPAKAK